MGKTRVKLNGGTFRRLEKNDQSLPSNWQTVVMDTLTFEIDGSVRFAQDASSTAEWMVENIYPAVTGTGTIVQSGVGTLKFHNLDFAGDFAVESGVLGITEGMLPFGGDTPRLTVGTGAQVNLGFAGTADIGYLTLGSRPRKAGVYSATEGRASDYLTGSGALNVTIGESCGMLILVR